MHTDAIPAKAGLTEEQLKEKGMLRVCPTPKPTPATTGKNGNFTGLFQPLSDPNNPVACTNRNTEIINANKPQEYVPAKDWYREASPQEYSFCTHSNGL